MPRSVAQLLQLQAGAGNQAVAALFAQSPAGRALAPDVLQRRVDPSAPPVPPTRTLPHEDPRFVAVKAKVKSAGRALKAHPKPSAEVNQARAAAEPPANDKDAQAKAAKVDDMAKAKPGTFDKAAFIAAVKKAIEANQPKTLEDADAAKGKSDVKNQVMGEVTKGKDASAADIKNATAAAPDPGVAKDKPVTPMPPGAAVATPSVPAASAMPAPVPPEQVNLQGGKHEVEGQMAAAGVDDETLAKSNEPQFKASLAAKKAGEEHASAAPAEVKAAEQNTLGGARAGATGAAAAQIAGMVAAKAGGVSKVGDSKAAAKAKEESERQHVATEIDKIFSSTKTETEAILKAIDPAVDAEFTKGEADAKAAFEAYHSSKMQAWKDKRYMGGLNYGQWIIDKIMDLPPEVNQFFVDARKVYIEKMEVVISNVADLIGRELTKARDRIAKGRADVKAFVAAQPGNLKKYAAEAEANIANKFEQLDQSVDDKQEALAEDLATKYSEARTAIDERVQALQDESKGLWSAAKSMVGETIQTILKLKDMLLAMFARVSSAVDRIIKDPIGFLGKFIHAVKAGLDKFVDNIGTHLKKGLQGWLFGALADAGIEIPDKFDFKGILKLVLSIIGATWTALRAMIVKRIGEPVMAKIEKAVGFVKTLITEGPAGLWKMFMAKLGDIKSMVMDQVKNFLITKVIVAGVTWLISMLNPASAFAKAVKMIVDVVNFFVEKGEAIKGVIDSAVESVEEILAGGTSKVAGMIENALAKVVPVLIGLLASLLGLGGISEKIKKILETLRKPVNKAMDFVVGKVVKIGKGLLRKLKNSKLGKKVKALKDKAKAAYGKGKAWVKGKIAAGKAWIKKKVGGAKEKAKKLIDKFKEKAGFKARGQSHSIYNNKPGEPGLMIASLPTPFEVAVDNAVASAQNPAKAAEIGNPLKSSYTKMLTDAAKLTGKARHAHVKIFINTSRIQVAKLFSMGGAIGSARHLGEKGAYSSQQGKSNRQQPIREHWLEAEHLIPRALTSALFEAVVPTRRFDAGVKTRDPSQSMLKKMQPDGSPPQGSKLEAPRWIKRALSRGRADYGRQTTIMIYERAARIKTKDDLTMVAEFKDFAENRAEEALTADWAPGHMEKLLVDEYNSLLPAAINSTVAAINAENKENDNAKLRADPKTKTPEAPSPTSTDVQAAGTAQLKDVQNQLQVRGDLYGG